jgi:hypothetical protein
MGWKNRATGEDAKTQSVNRELTRKSLMAGLKNLFIL